MADYTLFYAYDVLCGWCFGFTKTFATFLKNHPNEFKLQVVNGGMITGERVGPIGEVAGYISEAYKDVEERTGVKFGAGFLEGTMKEGTAIFDSIPLAKAHLAMVEQAPARAYEFASALHSAVYVDGTAPRDQEGLGNVAAALGLDRAQWLNDVVSEKIEAQMQQGFQLTSHLEVTGFPTLVLADSSGRYVKFSSGALPLEHLEDQFKRAKEALATATS